MVGNSIFGLIASFNRLMTVIGFNELGAKDCIVLEFVSSNVSEMRFDDVP
jgi:hypothetical protein